MHTAIWHHRRCIYTYNIYRNVASCEAIVYHTMPFFLPTVSEISDERTKNHTHISALSASQQNTVAAKARSDEDEIVPAASTV